MGINDLVQQNDGAIVTELTKPQKQFKTLVLDSECVLDEMLADYTADGWRIIHQNDVVAYNDDRDVVLHIVRLERTLGLKAITG